MTGPGRRRRCLPKAWPARGGPAAEVHGCRGVALEELLVDGMPVDAAEIWRSCRCRRDGLPCTRWARCSPRPSRRPNWWSSPILRRTLIRQKRFNCSAPGMPWVRLYEQGEFNGLGPWLWEHPWWTLLIGIFGTAGGVWLTFSRYTVQGSPSLTSGVFLLGLMAAVGGVCCLGFWFSYGPPRGQRTLISTGGRSCSEEFSHRTDCGGE